MSGEMTPLPHATNLPINLLAGCFKNTSATYRFNWLLAILDAFGKGLASI